MRYTYRYHRVAGEQSVIQSSVFATDGNVSPRSCCFSLGVLGFCSAQGGSGTADSSNSTDSATCEGSTADFCVRSCCPPGQNFFGALGSCATGTLEWEPSFLSGNVSVKVVGRPSPGCGPKEDLKVFSPHTEASIQFELQPSGELSIVTSKVYDLGHNYCFRNIEHGGRIYETVRSCVPKVVPQVPGLPSIDNVTEVSFQKCCTVGQVLAVDREAQDFGCVNGSFDWLPNVLHGDPTELTRLSPEKANVKAGNGAKTKFECPPNTVPQYLHPASAKYYLQADSQLLLATHNITIKADHFCLDLMQSSSSAPQVIAHVCYDEIERHTKEKFEELCPEGVCARKCCARGFMLSNNDCIPSTGGGVAAYVP